jgi:hypothetical protein
MVQIERDRPAATAAAIRRPTDRLPARVTRGEQAATGPRREASNSGRGSNSNEIVNSILPHPTRPGGSTPAAVGSCGHKRLERLRAHPSLGFDDEPNRRFGGEVTRRINEYDGTISQLTLVKVARLYQIADPCRADTDCRGRAAGID